MPPPPPDSGDLKPPAATSFEHNPEIPRRACPDQVTPFPSPEALLLLRACPTLCASILLLCRALAGGGARFSWTGWAFFLALVGPAAVEAWELQALRRKVRGAAR